jgi:sulfate adenylyltransferase
MSVPGERIAPYGGSVSAKTCPHADSDRLIIGGTQVRQRLEHGEMLPAEFTRAEVSRALVAGLRAWAEARA